MRGDDEICGSLFSYVDLEERVRAGHPLRVLREVANAALKVLGGEFAGLYSPRGRGSIPPERLLRALLLRALRSCPMAWCKSGMASRSPAGLAGSVRRSRRAA